MTKELYLIRHAESEHNAINNAFSGISDISISEIGKLQATKLKKYFNSAIIDEVFCSSLKRAKETAKIVFGESTPITYLESLREMNFGDYEGRYFDPEDYEDIILDLWSNQPSKLTFPNGDNIVDHANFIFHSIDNIMNSSEAHSIAIVSHSTSIRLFTAQVLGLPIDYFRRIPCSNCSVSKFMYEDSFRLISCNCTCYGDKYE